MVYIIGGGPLGDNIILADGDGQNPREIIKRAGARHIHWLRWAPDGRFVYFNYGVTNLNAEGPRFFERRFRMAGPNQSFEQRAGRFFRYRVLMAADCFMPPIRTAST
jgi:dipeptidyl aminopeptidase/acylaminoacyl peptidase